MGCGPRWTAAGTGGLGVQGQDGGQGRCSIAEGEAGGAVQKARAMWTASRVRMCGELAETWGGQGCIAHKPPSSSDPLFDLPVPPAAAKDRLCCTRVAVHVHPTSRTPATVGRGHLREERFASHHSLQSQTHWQAAGERRSHEEEEEQEQAAETAVAGASDPDASIMHRARFARERFVSETARACKKISCWRQSLFFFSTAGEAGCLREVLRETKTRRSRRKLHDGRTTTRASASPAGESLKLSASRQVSRPQLPHIRWYLPRKRLFVVHETGRGCLHYTGNRLPFVMSGATGVTGEYFRSDGWGGSAWPLTAMAWFPDTAGLMGNSQGCRF